MANEIESAKQDIFRMSNILKHYTQNIYFCTDCYPLIELNKFTKRKFVNEDLIIIQYSGHGKRIGKKINNKMELLSCWVNPDKSLLNNKQVDDILSKINCPIIFISDSCYSGNFTNYYKGNFPLLFIASSSIISISKEYNIRNFNTKEVQVKSGSIVGLLEEIFEIKSLDDILMNKNQLLELHDLLNNHLSNYLKKNNVKIKPVIKIYNTLYG
ncbi:MAG: hypothetical protein H0U27_09770 [Nitrosopumilus sp.]|nr:hypothetical protein [Nitrosopumilus sp.]